MVSAPVRTCIGCRQRAVAAELLRVVVISGDEPARESPYVVPDPRHRARGRGAWLHRDPKCFELAERRRAFVRALRVSGPVDPSRVREYVESLGMSGPSGIPQGRNTMAAR